MPEPLNPAALAPSSPGRRGLLAGALAVGAGAALAACTSNTPPPAAAPAPAPAGGSARRRTRAAGHDRLLRARGRPRLDRRDRRNAQAQAEKYSDVTFAPVNPTNDITQQIAAIETLINRQVDAPGDPARTTAASSPVAHQAMQAGIPVINLDRILRLAAGLPDLDRRRQLRHGRERRQLHRHPAQGRATPEPDHRGDRGHRQPAAHPGPQPGLQGRAGDVRVRGRAPPGRRLHRAGRAAGHREPPAGRTRLDALWNHDDDQGIGVLAAIQQANRERVLHGRRRRLGQRHARHPGRQHRAQGDGDLPADDGARPPWRWPGSSRRAGDERPGGAGGPGVDHAGVGHGRPRTTWAQYLPLGFES